MQLPVPSLRSLATTIACSLAAALSPALFAQTTATTDPVGFITLNVAGTGGNANQALSFKGLGLTRPVEYQGSAETVGTNSVTDNEATWNDNQFNGAAGAHYLEITSGPGAGTTYDITTTTGATKTITLGQNLGTGVANGATFKIRKHWTIATVFGPNNEGGLQGGSSSTADQVLIFNGTGYDVYYYQTVGFGTGWRNATSPGIDAADTKIYPDDGVLVRRQQTGGVNIVLMGAVKLGPSSIPVLTGNNIIGNVYAAPMTLATSGLYTGDPNTGLAGGSASSADQVLLWNGIGYDAYFYQTVGFGTGWRSAANPAVDASATPIPVGASVVVKRNGIAFDWKAPQHPATL